MLTLYLSPGFSSMAPHIALYEIGVGFETRGISFANREQYSPEYLALNPEGKVPTLLVDGRPRIDAVAPKAIIRLQAPQHSTSEARPVASVA